MTPYEEKIAEAVKMVRPSLQADGGDIEFVRFEESTGKAFVRLHGACRNCSISSVTLKQGVEKFLRSECDAVKEVVGLEEDAYVA